jgi:hypothetical protein
MSRSRRAGLSRDEVRQQPLYARMLGLQYLAPGGFLCFVFLEGAVALGILLALAELVSWWGVLVLPMMVAVMVKLNDVVAGALIRPAGAVVTSAPARVTLSPGAETVRLSPAVISKVSAPALRPATVQPVDADAVPGTREDERWAASDASALNGPPVTRQWTEDLDDQQQRARQSAARRYE